jgi:transcriptional regulator with XRE-family HTH domain
MLGQNQKDFSKQCGLDRSYFGGVERGERNLTFSNLCQICAGLNCDIAAVTEGIPHLTDGAGDQLIKPKKVDTPISSRAHSLIAPERGAFYRPESYVP